MKAEYKNGKLIVHFQFDDGLQIAEGAKLKGFSLDGRTDTDATIENNTVVIYADRIPSFIYYGWKPFSDANLVNKEKLPACTFKLKVK